MIVDRQAEIDAFHPEEYWTIDVMVRIGGKDYKASLVKVDGKPFECHTKEEADALCARIPDMLSVQSVTKSPKTIAAKPPFTTSSMQQEDYTNSPTPGPKRLPNVCTKVWISRGNMLV